MNNFKNYYEILKVPETATSKEIKDAYRKVAKMNHPDMTKEYSEEEQKRREETFKQASLAYEVLSNEKKRKEYNIEFEKYQEEQKRKKQTSKKENSIFQNIKKTYYHTKVKETPFNTRLKKYNERIKEFYPKLNIFGRGVIILFSESFTTIRKFKLHRNDNVYRYVIRNRKALAGILLATTLIYSNSGDKEQQEVYAENTVQTQTTTKETVKNQTTEPTEENITIIRTYKIKAGDTLSELAEDANCSIREIQRTNNIPSTTIYYGDTIQIPYHIKIDELDQYTTNSLYQGEGLETFAKKHETTIESLLLLNQGTIINKNNHYIITPDTLVTPNFTPYEFSSSKQNIKK